LFKGQPIFEQALIQAVGSPRSLPIYRGAPQHSRRYTHQAIRGLDPVLNQQLERVAG